MRISILPALAAAMLAAGGAQAATVINAYEFDGDYAGAKGGTIQGHGGSFETKGKLSGLRFQQNQGASLAQGLGSVYSIEMFFSLDQVNGYRKIVDFSGRTTDNGLYVESDLNFYPGARGGLFKADEMAHVVFNRDATGLVTGFINGQQVLSHKDSASIGVSTALDFFRDDTRTAGRESSAGFVDFIRLYDGPLTATEVAGLNKAAQARLNPTPSVPEPATWAMMIMGFGVVGHAARRRRATVRVAYAN